MYQLDNINLYPVVDPVVFPNLPIQEKNGSCMEVRPKGPSAFAAPGGKKNGRRKKF